MKKYIAIKLQGFDHWIWFETAKTKREHGEFEGRHGWGKAGAFTEIKTQARLIEGEIFSDTLQYI